MTFPNGSSDFVKKLYKVLEDPAYHNLIRWDRSGKSFIVLQPSAFTKIVLTKHFKHCNFSSFVRQLNKYDFHKVRNSGNCEGIGGEQCWEFKHEKFQLHNEELLDEIKRKAPASKGFSAANSRNALNEVHILQQQLDRLSSQQARMLQHIQMVHTNYEEVCELLQDYSNKVTVQDKLLEQVMTQMCGSKRAGLVSNPNNSTPMPAQQSFSPPYYDRSRTVVSPLSTIPTIPSTRGSSVSFTHSLSSANLSDVSQCVSTPSSDMWHTGNASIASTNNKKAMKVLTEANLETPTPILMKKSPPNSLLSDSQPIQSPPCNRGMMDYSLSMPHFPVAYTAPASATHSFSPLPPTADSSSRSYDPLDNYGVGSYCQPLMSENSLASSTSLSSLSTEASACSASSFVTASNENPGARKMSEPSVSISTYPIVLVLDSDIKDVPFTVNMFEGSGCVTYTASDAVNALRLLESQFIELLVIAGSALSVYDYLYPSIRQRHPFVVALLESVSEKDQSYLLEKGIDMVVLKPLNSNSVKTMLERTRAMAASADEQAYKYINSGVSRL
ncbi:transcription factor prr1 [Schizosaccharomyces japonicus yFS275]|uniref:Transcription factor prr1 n=1 Tax=Schizosaccharomyces japonicus (strain yFS275 / FY16936) TaxID=402676 RepID=B6JY73_SCHJY|nr:transcription factor prr1 [Schizosaccharomyces japonicus yFS275]EEB06491.2 transcription factor prr1 [Schizosaccharomyces japonicus yFS275]